MNKRNARLSVFIAIALTVLMTMPIYKTAYGAGKFNLKVACHMPANTKMSTVMDWWSKELEKRTDGKVKTAFYPADALGKYVDYPEMLKGRVCDVATLPGFRFPSMMAFELPFVAPGDALSIECANTLYHYGLLPDLKDFKLLWFQSSGPAFLFFRDKRPVTRDDFKGLKIRGLFGVWIEVPQKLGATGVAVPSVEVYQALERGIVDGGLIALAFYDEAKLFEVANIVASPPIIGGMLPVVMGIEQWKSLPLDVQFVIEQLNAEARYRFTQVQWYRSKEENYARMKELGCDVYQVSDEDVARWEKDTQPIIEDWATKAESKGLKAKEILAVIRHVAELFE